MKSEGQSGLAFSIVFLVKRDVTTAPSRPQAVFL